jgi:hypothetical protein
MWSVTRAKDVPDNLIASLLLSQSASINGGKTRKRHGKGKI